VLNFVIVLFGPKEEQKSMAVNYMVKIMFINEGEVVTILGKTFFSYQLNAQFLYSITIYMLHYNPRNISSSTILIFRRSDCIITVSGIVNICKLPYSSPAESGLQSALNRWTVLYGSELFSRRRQVHSWSKNFPHLMGLGRFISIWKEQVTCPCPDPDKWSKSLHFLFLWDPI
jgi:hypothetical protein